VAAHRLAVMFGDPGLEREPLETYAPAATGDRAVAAPVVARSRAVPSRRVAAFAAIGAVGVGAAVLAAVALSSLARPVLPPGRVDRGWRYSLTVEPAALTPDAVLPTAEPTPARRARRPTRPAPLPPADCRADGAGDARPTPAASPRRPQRPSTPKPAPAAPNPTPKPTPRLARTDARHRRSTDATPDVARDDRSPRRHADRSADTGTLSEPWDRAPVHLTGRRFSRRLVTLRSLG
jgi:hypothetical protein